MILCCGGPLNGQYVRLTALPEGYELMRWPAVAGCPDGEEVAVHMTTKEWV
jgi:hypothetical protein